MSSNTETFVNAKEFDTDAMDNILYKDGLDWTFEKPKDGAKYSIVYIVDKEEEDEEEEPKFKCSVCSVDMTDDLDEHDKNNMEVDSYCNLVCHDCYLKEHCDIIDTTDDYWLCHGFKSNGESSDWYIMPSNGTNDIIGEYETEEAARDQWKKYIE